MHTGQIYYIPTFLYEFSVAYSCEITASWCGKSISILYNKFSFAYNVYWLFPIMFDVRLHVTLCTFSTTISVIVDGQCNCSRNKFTFFAKVKLYENIYVMILAQCTCFHKCCKHELCLDSRCRTVNIDQIYLMWYNAPRSIAVFFLHLCSLISGKVFYVFIIRSSDGGHHKLW